MEYKDFQNLDYLPSTPMEVVLSDLLFKHQIDVNTVLIAYTSALEKQRHIDYCKFEEACINLTQILSPNFKIIKPECKNQNYKVEAIKRAIHTLNHSQCLPRNVHNEEYGYTEEDKKQWDEFCKMHYGDDFKDW